MGWCLPHTYLQFKSKNSGNSTISVGKHEKCLEINLETIIWVNYNRKNEPKLVRDSGLELLTFQRYDLDEFTQLNLSPSVLKINCKYYSIRRLHSNLMLHNQFENNSGNITNIDGINAVL